MIRTMQTKAENISELSVLSQTSLWKQMLWGQDATVRFKSLVGGRDAPVENIRQANPEPAEVAST